MIAVVRKPVSDTKRIMIYDTGNGVYLFGYNTLNDAGACWDQWHENIQEAIAAALEEYGTLPADWEVISEPLDNCQHDWIAPIRVKGRLESNPEWGHLEKLVNGQWVPFELAL
ncbi:hypothetical protein [Hymenobacter sp. HDW8]|uniref:hypothetical protein n=1 Tax=Hymenobacter sp. HDW8 TaxID=2714932 RepID=UPI00140C8E33|nr:hypothetical protein [Hymenobacter sp. HDW8]QIL76528.1 hypothetical protein G7064_12165 [Hymenobacter sp. HDW8]